MNLKTLFNFNYFKENVRKSKGLLAFLLGVIPIVNIIFLIILLTGSSNNLLDFNIISFFTYVGIIFIPLALSVSLFGFVFGKKSVDFIMSKPISRKTIFLTNIFGGIFIILIFMLMNTLIFALFSLIFPSLTIPFLLLVDYFIFWFISYLFMFMVTSLAVALTGNMITSIVVSLIILLLVPYLNGINYITGDYYYNNNYIKCTEEECKPNTYYCYNDADCINHLAKNEYQLYYGELFTYNFTAPLAAFNSIANTNTSFYNSLSLVKMLILSAMYGVIGYIAFKKRKMENNETSFRKPFAHYLVKGITLFPICLLTYAIIDSTGVVGWLITIVGIIIYSIIYDLITRKEIYKPIKSLIITLFLFMTFTGAYALYFKVLDSPDKVITEVDSIYWEGMEITDPDLINYIIASAVETKVNTNSYGYDLIFTNKNKKYSVSASINDTVESLLMDELSVWQKEKIANFNFNHIDFIEYNNTMIPVTTKIKDLIKENIDEVQNFDMTILSEAETLSIYTYKNHKYENVKIPVKISEELFSEIINYQNELYLKYQEKTAYEPYFDLYAYEEDIFTNEDYYVFDYVIKSNLNEFISYLKNNNEIDVQKDLAYIRAYDFNKNKEFTITIGDAESFKKEFDSYKEKLKDNEEYQNYIKEFQDMYGVTTE